MRMATRIIIRMLMGIVLIYAIFISDVASLLEKIVALIMWFIILGVTDDE